MRFIDLGKIDEIALKDSDKIRTYLGEYMPFHAQFGRLPQRSVDKALWAFGRFIKENVFPYVPLR